MADLRMLFIRLSLLVATSVVLAVSSAIAAPFTAGNVVVCRVGDGAAALTSAATPVFLDEFTPAGTLVQSIAMPTAVSGSNQILTVAGTSTNDCTLTRSSNGSYLLIAGYTAPVGTAAVAGTTSAAFPRVIGRIDANGVVDTSTTTTAFSTANIRSATSDNGTNIWAVGSASGVVYTTLGGSGAGTVVSNTATNLRVINNFGGQLYVSSGAGSIRFGAVGTGLPTANGTTTTTLGGMPAITATYNGFFFADLDAGIAGLDTLYIANDAAVNTPPNLTSGGILKFARVGPDTWAYNGTFAAVAGPPAITQASFFGLAGSVSGSNVTLYSTKGAQLLSVVDSTGYNAAPTANLTQIATNTANTLFRSVALVPSGGVVPPTMRSPFDFDGDGKTDISIFRPTPAEWWYLKSSNGGNAALQFGASGDLLTPADFTGDGKTDVALFRPSTGNWFVLRSEDFSFFAFPFGTSGDVPVPADYDGDGKADAAVFRESAATWYVSRSSGGTDIVGFGATGDKPAVADYDGDGRADIAIWRPNAVPSAAWWIRRSSNASVFAVLFGTSTDKAVYGDYTGDGKADMAFWRPATGEWNVLRSNDFSFFAFPFGISSDVPVPGDYDGDGKFDAGVFRPSTNTWYIQRSTAGTLIQQFGANGDLAIPNVYVR